jgi:hypothetical protein
VQEPNRLDVPVVGLRNRASQPGRSDASSTVSIERIGFAVKAPRAAVGAVDIDDLEARCEKDRGQRGAVASGAFDSDSDDDAGPDQPCQQCAVAGAGCRELSVADFAAEVVDDRRVVGVFVSIDACNDGEADIGWVFGHAGHWLSLRQVTTHRPGRRTTQ